MNLFGNLEEAIRDKEQVVEAYDLMHGRDGLWKVLCAELNYLISLDHFKDINSFEAQSKVFSAEKQMLEAYLKYDLNEKIQKLNWLYDEWSYFAI